VDQRDQPLPTIAGRIIGRIADGQAQAARNRRFWGDREQ
jgi:hypothetical protein